ncbi:MAG TPA: alpha-1,4-glucan--maltose-1-phosphate maltosyltransferase [Acidobacteriaceae bacterium]|jgi:starch synthase (maltosyl-transferring)|nr:alpha-1,4-glucan--maltose-1-phosphate maltosyltransferase [Acidobacteriaceae bacterium]
MQKPADGRKRVVIESVEPEIDAGRFAIKRIVGDQVDVEADVFADGHDHVATRLLFRYRQVPNWSVVPMQPLGNDRWRASFPVVRPGEYLYTVAGWIDHFDTWRSDLEKRIAAAQDIHVDLLNGAQLVEQAAERGNRDDADALRRWAAQLRNAKDTETAQRAALDPALAALMAQYPDPRLETRYERELRVVVDREKARYSAWYEMFPRSSAAQPGRHGTLRDCEARLDYVARLGFDVLYLPPLHPIGRSYRKGKNNSVTAQPGDVGSPWAIGANEGGHFALHPELGTLDDFRSLLRSAAKKNIEMAMDVAFQCSPDHPWVQEHPEWFKKRADGSIQYAENPPKKYQDIYPLDFESGDWEGLWEALRDVFLFWIEQGIRIFRVDNPHTKSFPFWEWLIAEIKHDFPDALFLAEAFTRPRVMQRLAKLGFSQSYTYFSWRNTKQELTEYLTELTHSRVRDFLRPNLWPNTPDILPEALQIGGRPAFLVRVVLAATLGSNYGIYGPAFELGENQPLRPGSEEYLNSEKYEIREWNLDAPHSIAGAIADINRARRENTALHANHDLFFHPTDNPYLIAYSKSSRDGSSVVLTVVNLDPFHTQLGWVDLDLERLQLRLSETFQVFDQLSGRRFLWQGAHNYIELSPESIPAHIFRVLRRVRSERDFDYYQ